MNGARFLNFWRKKDFYRMWFLVQGYLLKVKRLDPLIADCPMRKARLGDSMTDSGEE